MNYLDLMNKVLTRLRENEANTGNYASDPFYRSIGAFVNDAKLEVEDAWRWSQNRGQVQVGILQGESIIELPESLDNNYQILSIKHVEQSNFLKPVSSHWMQRQYRTEVPEGQPQYYSWYFDSSFGNKQIRILAPPNANAQFEVYFHRRGPELVEPDDTLAIPAMPVYLLALAYAATERGEVRGLTTSEHFSIARSALSDAIAYDTAQFPQELDWWSQDDLNNTNVRNW
jgi:hypothetical protein